MRIRQALAIPVLFHILPAAAVWAVEIPFIDLAAETGRQVVVDREDGQYLGHPTTCLLDDGQTVLCVYPKGHGRGGIVYKRSEDGGRTWSERLPTPASWAGSKEVPTLYRTVDAAGKKRIIMFSGLYPIRMAVSEDEGQSWGELEPIGDFGGIVAMSSVVPLRTGPGHYLALFHDDGRFITKDAKPQSPTVMTLYGTLSTDGGLTWSPPKEIYASAEIHLCEPGAVRSPDGEQIAVLLRENARRRNSFVIFSDDEGATWSEPRELPITLTGDRHTAKYLPDGRLFISFRGRTAKGEADGRMPSEGDWAAWLGSYRDIAEGQPGQYVIRIADNTKGWDTTYPGVELLPDWSILTTTYGHWHEGEQPYILSVRLKASELDQRAEMAAKLELSKDGKRAVRLVREAPSVRIWDDAPHNAFTALARFDGALYCAFREGAAHVYGEDGKARVLVSQGGESWRPFDLVAKDGVDLRDPKLSVTPDGRLMLLLGGSRYEGQTFLGRSPHVAFLKPGSEAFGELQEVKIDPRVATDNDWLWRVTWHGDTGFGVAYQPRELHYRNQLVSTEDGIHYRLVRALDLPHKPGEATIRFDAEERMLIVTRNEGGDKHGFLGVAEPPFTSWEWQPINYRLGGPNFIATPGGHWLMATRRYSRPTRTVLGSLHLEDAHFEPKFLLPSAGDTSYPGLLIHDGQLWVSYYSSHAGKSAIYLARFPLAEFDQHDP